MDRIDCLRRAVAAYEAGDVTAAGALFADGAMWLARDPAAPGCRNRHDIEQMMRQARDSKITWHVEELVAVGDAVVAGFRCPDASDGTEPARIDYRVFGFEGASVVRVENHPGRDAALAAAAQARGPGDVALEVRSVTKGFRRRPVLSEVSMTVRRGEAIAVIGENGAGKSTLLRLCAGLDVPDDGAVRRFARVGYCPQEPALFDLLSAEEHLRLFGAGRQASMVAEGRGLLTALGIPAGARTLARDLSGGERQKLSLTLALLGQPGLLLLDEPYQGFDHGSYVDFWRLVDTWREEGKAIVVVTHLLTELDRVDRVVELRRAGVRS